METRILVTGAEGGLAQAFVERAVAPGFSLAPAYPDACEVIALSRRALDVSRRNDVDRVVDEVKPRIIVNASGLSDPEACEYQRWQAYLVHRDAAEHLGRAAQRHEALVVNFSTDLLFDGGQKTPYAEEDPPNPLNVFGDTKLAGELVTMSHCKRFLILRCGWLYGPRGHHYVSRVLGWLPSEPAIFGYEDVMRQPTFTGDLVDALLHLLKTGLTGIFHCANSGGASDFEVAHTLLRLVGREGVEVRGTRHGVTGRSMLVPRFSQLKCSKLDQSGHRMRPWDEALREFVGSLDRSDR